MWQHLLHIFIVNKILAHSDSQEMTNHSNTLAWKTPWTEEPGRLYSPWGCKGSDTTELLHFHFQILSSLGVIRYHLIGS